MRKSIQHIVIIILALIVTVFSSGVGVVKHYCGSCHETISSFYSEDYKGVHNKHMNHECCSDHSCNSCCHINHKHSEHDDFNCKKGCNNELFQIAVVNLSYSSKVEIKTTSIDLLKADYGIFQSSFYDRNFDHREFIHGNVHEFYTGRQLLSRNCVLLI